jgi:hypothetical protein
MSTTSKPSGIEHLGFSCKPDVLAFSVNNLTKCSFASTTLCNSSGETLAFSISPRVDGIFRIDPPSGVLKKGQTVTLFVTMLHSQLLMLSNAHESPNRDLFSFDCVKLLEGQGLRIRIRHAVANPTPADARPSLPSSQGSLEFPPVQPGNVILAGVLKKVNFFARIDDKIHWTM